MNADSQHRPDALAALLRHADAAAPLPPADARLADLVRRLSRRRRNRRRVAAGCMLALIAASAVAVLQSSRGRSHNGYVAKTESSPDPAAPIPAPPEPAAIAIEAAAEYNRAKHEAEARFAFADRLLAAERRRRLLDEVNARLGDDAPTQVDRIASLRGAAAQTLIGQADRLNSRADSPLDALATYRRAMELFPDTPWVAVARQRIEELEFRMRNQENPS